MIGDVFVIRHDVNLHTEILDTPDFFWDEKLCMLKHLYLHADEKRRYVTVVDV
jgi:uncharacterized Rmd1/YagE family protein